MGVTVRLDSTEIEAQPGDQAVCPVYLENDGMVVDSYLLDVLGDAAPWVSVEPSEINLLPQAKATARLVFKPPRSAECPAGAVPFGLRVMSREDPDGSKIEEGVVTVAEFTEITAGLVPKTANGRRSAKYKLLVENHGNRTEQVAVSAADQDVKLHFRVDPPMFDAEPGTATYVKLKAIPHKTFLKGSNKSLPFSATVLPDGGEAATADGVMLEQQTMPKWLLPVLGAAMVAAVALIALWLAVLKPVVHSAATAAANAQSAASAAAKNASSAAAPPKALDVTLTSGTLLAGSKELATVSGSAASGATASLPALVWTSSAPGVAVVSQTGEVTAVGPGSATITATSANAPASRSGGGALTGTSSGSQSQLTADPILSGTVTVNVVGPVTVAVNTLPEAAVGKAYSATVSAGGGTGTFTYSISAGALPAGLSLDPSTGAVSGTPTVLGPASFTVHVDDAGPPTQFATQDLTLTVINALQVNTASLPNATIGAPYSQTLAAVGGTGPYTWSVAAGGGTLPAGLSLNGGTGVISGTPTGSGASTFTVKSSDSGTPSQSATQSLTINAVAGVLISTLSLPDAVVGTPYSQTPVAAGGTMPYTWSVAAGALPAGLALNPVTGAVGGTPSAPSAANASGFTLQATDSGKPNLVGSQAYNVNVVQPFAITTSSLPDGAAGTVYPTAKLSGTGGTTPYVWALRGTLPPGLSLSPDGEITGTPTATGQYSFTVQAADGGHPPLSATQNLTITIVSPLKITTTSVADGVVGAPYSQTLDATGGTQPYAWTVTVGTLPDNLSLNASTGAITGTPGTATVSPTPQVTIKVTDKTTPSLTDTVTLPITVVQPLAFNEPGPLPFAVAGQAYPPASPPNSTTPTASGGSGGYKWSLGGGTALPTGLVLDPKTGIISGMVDDSAAGGTDSFQLTVTDSGTPPLSLTNQETIVVVSQLSTTAPPTLSFKAGQAINPVNLNTYVKGGTAPYIFSTSTPDSFDGLTVTNVGGLQGTPVSDNTVNQSVTITVTVNDNTPNGRAQQATLTVAVDITPSDLVITWAGSTLPPATAGMAYNESTFQSQSGGISPYTYSVKGGTGNVLADGLTLNADGTVTGTIVGTACTADTFTAVATSRDGQTSQQTFTIDCTTPTPTPSPSPSPSASASGVTP